YNRPTFVFHGTVWNLSRVHPAPAGGKVTVNVGATSVKGTSLTSPSCESPAGLTRTSACGVTPPGIRPSALPIVADGVATLCGPGVHVTPPSALTSMSNSAP